MLSKNSLPFISVNITPTPKEIGLNDPKVLIIAQSSGTTGNLELKKNVQQSQVEEYYGKNSLMTYALNRFWKHSKNEIQVDTISLTNPSGGVGSEGGFVFDGTATETKVVTFRPFDDEFKIDLQITKGDTKEVVAQALTDAINANTDLPFTATKDTATCKIKSLAFGTTMDGCIARFSEEVAGLTISELESSGGSGVFVTANIFNDVYDRYHTIVFDSSLSFDTVAEFLEPRFNSENSILGGIGVTVSTEALSNAKSEAESRNQKTMVVIGNFEIVSTQGRGKFNAIPILLASEFAAKRSLRFKNGAIISDILATTREYLGGMAMATLPYHNTPMSYLSSINESEMSIQEVKELNKLGYSLLVNSQGYSKLGSMVTFYKKNPSGLDDNTYHYLNSVDSAMVISEYFFLNLKNLTSQSRFTPDAISAGAYDIYNKENLLNELVSLYQDLSEMQITKAGSAYINAFKQSVNIDILNDDTKTINISGTVEAVGQIRSIIFNVSFS